MTNYFVKLGNISKAARSVTGRIRSAKVAVQLTSALQLLMGATAFWWLVFWLVLPMEATLQKWFLYMDDRYQSHFLGMKGSVFLLQVLPAVALTLLSFVVIELRRRVGHHALKRTEFTEFQKAPKENKWTSPYILSSPLGMLTFVDIIFIVTVLITVLWYIVATSLRRAWAINHAIKDSGGDDSFFEPYSLSRQAQIFEAVGVILGKAILVPFALLWIPVSRGSPLLRAAGIPFEHAVKYHTWLGMLTLWLVIAHSIVFILSWPATNHTSKLWRWPTGHKRFAPFPAVVAFVAGVIMLLMSLSNVRRKNFNLFFIVHHLYLVFLVFFAFHAVTQMPFVVIPVLLFFLDRFMRMVQSRKSVDVLSMRVLPSNVLELKFAKPEYLTYYPLSHLFVLLPSVSRFEWHPFSTASSPLDETNQICIYIKPLGGFTKQLHDVLIDYKQHKDAGKLKCPFSFKLAVEGPYGDESNFYLKYNSLILIAGGIGVTPHLAILRDVLHRYRMKQLDLPSSIKLILCVRNAKDLYILDTLNPLEIFADYEKHLDIEVLAYITSAPGAKKMRRGSKGAAVMGTLSYEDYSYTYMKESPVQYQGPPLDVVKGVSVLVGTGNNAWAAATVFATIVGFLLLHGMVSCYFLVDRISNVGEVILYFVCMLLSVLIFGGGAMYLWSQNFAHRRQPDSKNKIQQQAPAVEVPETVPPSPLPTSVPSPMDFPSPIISFLRRFTQEEVKSAPPPPVMLTPDIEAGAAQHTSWQGTVMVGKKPNWQDLFDKMTKQYGGQDVGVLVSGHEGMQRQVATECKHHSLTNVVVFHYHSVSFQM
ncbi:hypothetical protein Mapa_009802 [Marchantia paleacea]|nr:hypothetical protein Mapa_009802 [Marchantia paleacea]